VKRQSGSSPATCSTDAGGRFLVLLGEITAIAYQIYDELKRLNRGGDYPMSSSPAPRRQQAQAFKAALAQRYRDHNRCC